MPRKKRVRECLAWLRERGFMAVTADTITDEQIRELWRAKRITSTERNRAIRTYRGMGANVRHAERARCATLLNE